MIKKNNHFDLKKDIDLIGLGNAIVDIIVNVDDKFLEINTLKKGSMNLINSNESEALLKNCTVIKKISGGSSCLLYTSPSPRDRQKSRMPSSA